MEKPFVWYEVTCYSDLYNTYMCCFASAANVMDVAHA